MIARLLVLALAGAALAEAPPVHATFDHEGHRKALERAGLSCTACHALGEGEATSVAADEAALAAPKGACHACHTDPERHVARAPSRCDTCHDQVGPPPDHVAGWLEDHGAASRTGDCSDCHRPASCVACHERRESARYTVHDASWLGVHAIAVQADPSSCGSCHAPSFCTSCHATGRSP